jgi:hypothetical protein
VISPPAFVNLRSLLSFASLAKSPILLTCLCSSVCTCYLCCFLCPSLTLRRLSLLTSFGASVASPTSVVSFSLGTSRIFASCTFLPSHLSGLSFFVSLLFLPCLAFSFNCLSNILMRVLPPLPLLASLVPLVLLASYASFVCLANFTPLGTSGTLDSALSPLLASLAAMAKAKGNSTSLF